MSTYTIPCLESSPTPSHMPKLNVRKILFLKQKGFCSRKHTTEFGKYIGQPSEVNYWVIFPKQSWISLQDELLDNSPRQFFGKSSLEIPFTTSFVFHFLSCHALTPIYLGCPSAYEMHYVISKQFMLIYLNHAYINKFTY